MKQGASGARGFAEIEVQGYHSCALGFKPTLPPHLVKSIYLTKLGSIHSFANCVMWCKLLWFLDCGCCGSGASKAIIFIA